MGKADAIRWLENQYFRQYLRGTGIEIGALWRRFPVDRGARVVYLDRADVADLKAQYSDVQEKIFLPDVVADATELPAAPGSLDFIIASHVLEHLPFPLAAIRAWYEALAPGGALLIKIPDKRYTFDLRRDRTPLARLISENEDRSSFDWHSHYVEFVEKVHGREPDCTEVARAVPALKAGDLNIHYHAWIDEDLADIVKFTRGAGWAFDWTPKIFLRARYYRKEAAVLLIRESSVRH